MRRSPSPVAFSDPSVNSSADGRRGAITVWLIVAIPALLTLICVVAEIGNLWLARIELTNSLESSALAAVKEWGDSGGGDTEVPREVGRIYALSNTVNGAAADFSVVDPGNPINYNPANPNDNDDCDGTLIFGAIVDDDPEFVFCADRVPSCGCGGIRVDALKADSGASTEARQIGIFYEDGPAGVTITSASFRLPQNPAVMPNQQPYWDLNVGNVPGRSPVVSDFDAPDAFNLNNPTPEPYLQFPGEDTYDVRGLVPDPIPPPAATPEGSDYRAPGNVPPPPFPLPPAGDAIFTFEDPVPTFVDRFQVLTIHFRPGTFEPPSDPMDPDTFEFIRFGASMNQLNPPAFPPGGNNNDADKMGIEGVGITIRLSNGEICTGSFVDDGINNGYSPSTLGGGDAGNAFAVRAQATYEVPSICCELFGLSVGPFNVSAKADALYDCQLRAPRLYHIEEDNFFCGVPCPIP